MSYIFMLCSCRLNKCSISYWQSIMNFNTIKQQIEMIIMKNRWLYSLLLVSIIYLVLLYFNFTAYIGDYLEEEKYGFCIDCNRSVMCGTCKCARTLFNWIVKWWRLSLLHTLWLGSRCEIAAGIFCRWQCTLSHFHLLFISFCTEKRVPTPTSVCLKFLFSTLSWDQKQD